MKKIMFNDRYGLTQAVLEGRKTQTRRVISVDFYNRVDWKYFEEGHNDCIIDDDISILDCGRYYVGEIVAIAQPYKDCKRFVCLQESAGWSNKMFVKAELMPHHIKITNVRMERLQVISEEDCMREGIIFHPNDSPDLYYFFDKESSLWNGFNTAKKAYATLIDKVGKKGTWDSNPWVFVYEFELVD